MLIHCLALSLCSAFFSKSVQSLHSLCTLNAQCKLSFFLSSCIVQAQFSVCDYKLCFLTEHNSQRIVADFVQLSLFPHVHGIGHHVHHDPADKVVRPDGISNHRLWQILVDSGTQVGLFLGLRFDLFDLFAVAGSMLLQRLFFTHETWESFGRGAIEKSTKWLGKWRAEKWWNLHDGGNFSRSWAFFTTSPIVFSASDYSRKWQPELFSHVVVGKIGFLQRHPIITTQTWFVTAFATTSFIKNFFCLEQRKRGHSSV